MLNQGIKGYRGGWEKAPLKARKNDLYETPIEATQALLRVEQFQGPIWEPACGPGAIVRQLRSFNYHVFASDLVDYNSPDQDETGWDFLMCLTAPIGCKTIVTNPPFKLATQFVHHGLILCDKVVMLLRLAFIEGGTDRTPKRREVLDRLSRMYVFTNRLPMMHRDGFSGKKSTSQTAFAWFVFEKDHQGPVQLQRITWE